MFNYYKMAAERIVEREEALEAQILELQEQRADVEADLSKAWYWLLTIIFFFVYFIKKNSLTRQIEEIDEAIEALKEEHRSIFRDYRVTKIGVGYVPVADEIKYQDKSFVVDYTGQVSDKEVTLRMSRRSELLGETVARLDELTREAPLVESSEEVETLETDDYSTSIQHVNQHDYLGALERSLRTVSFCMSDMDTVSVTLPLASRGSDYLRRLDEFATTVVPAGAPVVNIFDTGIYSAPIDRFKEIASLKETLSDSSEQFEEVIKGLMGRMAAAVQTVTAMKVASVDKVVFESNKILYTLLKAPYNHYSPQLEWEEIERIRQESFDYTEDSADYEPFNLRRSSRVKYNMLTGMWVAEDGSVTNMPFGVHQLYEEIVTPMVQNLMAENRIERLKIYNHIKDQKLSYLTKWHQDTEAFYRANRAESADIINLMQESLREYIAAYNTLLSLKRTEQSMASSTTVDLKDAMVETVDNAAESAAAFELQAAQFRQAQESFEQFMEQLKEDIDARAASFGHVEYYDAKMRDGHSNEVAVAAASLHDLDERRRGLAAVNPLFAGKSNLPPRPRVENLAAEHMSINLPGIARAALEELERPVQAPPTRKVFIETEEESGAVDAEPDVAGPMPEPEPEPEPEQTADGKVPPVPPIPAEPENEND